MGKEVGKWKESVEGKGDGEEIGDGFEGIRGVL